jgi:DNA-binding CsgD family transcriptional regulator
MSSSEHEPAATDPAGPAANPAAWPERVLPGRAREIAQLRALAQGSGGALVLRGEAGAGQTALLTEFARLAGERRLLWLPGARPEAGLPWAALHRLLLSFPAELERLSRPRRDALDTAFGIDAASADPGLVESAAMAVLAGVAPAGLALVIDNLQWIDRESMAVLHALARRSHDLPLTVLAAIREPAPTPALAGVPELTVAGLPVDTATELILRQAGAVLDRRTAQRLGVLCHGNPLTLIETGRRLADGQADVVDILGGQRLAGLSLPASFAAEIRALPEPTRALLILAACDTGADPRRFWLAAKILELGPETLVPARQANVVSPGSDVAFRHPLLRAAAVDCASPRQWRSSHRALAAASGDPAGSARAWHRAAAACGPDDEIAADLARHAQAPAGDRDALREVSWLALAARLAATEPAVASHYLAASGAALDASAPRLGEELLGRARPARGGAHEASGQRLAIRINTMLGRPAGQASHQMFAAATRLAASDRQAGLHAMQEAAQLAVIARPGARLAFGSALIELTGNESPPGDLLPGLASLLGGEYGRAVPLLFQALRAPRGTWNSLHGAGAAEVYVARALWADEHLLAWSRPTARPAAPGNVRARSGHDLAATFASWSAALASTGHLDEADGMAVVARRLARSVGWGPPLLATLDGAELHAWRGDGPAAEQAASRQAAAAAELERADLGNSATAALMTLHLSRCHYAAAFAAAEALASADLGGHANQALSVLVEAGTRLGYRDAARRALAELSLRATASGTAWALGSLSLARALLAGDTEAADAYQRSIALLDATGVISERARARLLYGEWLRRKRQRIAARTWLAAACQLFQQMGAAEFGARAQRELDATAPPSPPSGKPSRLPAGPALTLAERRIAERAAAGATNREIAAELFVSRRTVDHHLRNTYGKLGVSSRRQLWAALPASALDPRGRLR